MSWQPSEAAYRAGIAAQGVLQYVGGAEVLPGEALQRSPGPGAELLARYIREHFTGVRSVGLRRGSEVQRPLVDSSTGIQRKRDIHEEGRALDVMVSSRGAGEAVANWLVLHAVQLGVQFVLWDGVEWSVSGRGPAWELYAGANPHTDHVHVELVPALAGSSRSMQAAIDAAISQGNRESGASELVPTLIFLGGLTFAVYAIKKRQRRSRRR